MNPAEPVAPGKSEWKVGTVVVGGHRLPMKQITFGETLAAEKEGEVEPFWAHVWPIGRALAEHIFAGPELKGIRCLDLGTGSGIVGIALGLKGAHVTFADLSEESLVLAGENARRCGVSEFELLKLDWRAPPDVRFEQVYAADVAYDHEHVDGLAKSFRSLIAPGGVAYLADPRRPQLDVLLAAFKREGFEPEFLCDEPERVIVKFRALSRS